jgi:hypothetical protein
VDDAFKRNEITIELRRARNWILGVGILMFIVDQLVFAVSIPPGADPAAVSAARTWLLKVDGALLGFFVGMYFLARVRPVIGCVLALIGFWGVALWAASLDGGSIFHGIIVKILFTMALVRGIKSASRAEQLQSELGKVFE